MREKNIENKIKEYLSRLDHCLYWKNHGGLYSVIGLPDIMAIYRGKLYAFEIKNSTGQATKKQEEMISRLNGAGAIASIVREPDQVVDIIKLNTESNGDKISLEEKRLRSKKEFQEYLEIESMKLNKAQCGTYNICKYCKEKNNFIKQSSIPCVEAYEKFKKAKPDGIFDLRYKRR